MGRQRVGRQVATPGAHGRHVHPAVLVTITVAVVDVVGFGRATSTATAEIVRL